MTYVEGYWVAHEPSIKNRLANETFLLSLLRKRRRIRMISRWYVFYISNPPSDKWLWINLFFIIDFQLLKSSEEISLTVAGTSPLSAPVTVSQSYSWVTSDLRSTSPPADYNPRKHHHQVSTVRRDHNPSLPSPDQINWLLEPENDSVFLFYIKGIIDNWYERNSNKK